MITIGLALELSSLMKAMMAVQHYHQRQALILSLLELGQKPIVYKHQLLGLGH